jgi:hypothetical protein
VDHDAWLSDYISTIGIETKKLASIYDYYHSLPCSQVLNIIENHHFCYHMSGLELAGAIRVRATKLYYSFQMIVNFLQILHSR